MAQQTAVAASENRENVLSSREGVRAKITDADGCHHGPASVRYCEASDMYWVACPLGHVLVSEIHQHERDRWDGRTVSCSGVVSGYGELTDEDAPKEVIEVFDR